MEVIGVLLIFAFVFGSLGNWIACQKNRDGGEGFLLGCLFGPLGVIIEAVLPTISNEAIAAAERAQAQEDAWRQAQREAQREAQRQRRAQRVRESRAKLREFLVKFEAEQKIRSEEAGRQRSKRRKARDKELRARGIDPDDPLAWYRVMPDLAQALLLSVAFAVPAAVLFVVVVKAMH
jgi:hypothetical protein